MMQCTQVLSYINEVGTIICVNSFEFKFIMIHENATYMCVY